MTKLPKKNLQEEKRLIAAGKKKLQQKINEIQKKINETK